MLVAASISLNAQVDHVEPPFWWAGMKNPIIFFSIWNWLKDVLPGKFDINFIKDGEIVHSYTYELKKREPGSAEREGFNNSDVMYLIMPDRFANGDPSNDDITGMKEGINRKEPFGRHGGDIKGITDNHDMSRFYMQVGMDVDLFKTGIVYILTTRGIPQIFYGTEILMTHTESNSHGDIRKDFPGGWKDDEKNAFSGKGLSKKEIRIQDFFRKLLNWRKENPVIHTGKLTHFVPENGVYVYFRYNDKKKVMIILNKNNNDFKLKLVRFSEILGNCTKGKDVLSEKVYNLEREIILPASTPLVLELVSSFRIQVIKSFR